MHSASPALPSSRHRLPGELQARHADIGLRGLSGDLVGVFAGLLCIAAALGGDSRPGQCPQAVGLLAQHGFEITQRAR